MKSRDIRKWLCFLVALAIVLSAVPAFASETGSVSDKEILVKVENADGVELGDFTIGIKNLKPEGEKPIDVKSQLAVFGDREVLEGQFVDPYADAATVVLSSLPGDSVTDAFAKVAFQFVDENGEPIKASANGIVTTAPTIIRGFKQGEEKTVGEVVTGVPKGFTLLNANAPIDTSKEFNNQEVVLAAAPNANGELATMKLDANGNLNDVKLEAIADVSLMAIEMAPKQIVKISDSKDVTIKQEDEIIFDVYNAEEIDVLLASFTPEQRAEIENSENVTVSQIMNIYFNMFLNDPEIIVKDIDVFVPIKKVATTIPKTADPTSMMSLVTLMVSGLGMVALKKKIK